MEEGMTLFILGGKDFTKNILAPKYKMNALPKYHEWTDGNYVIHRNVNRMQVKGDFTIWFDDLEEYYTFLDLLTNTTGAGGYTPVTVYVNNKHTTQSINAFITIEPENNEPYMGVKKHDGFKVTVEER